MKYFNKPKSSNTVVTQFLTYKKLRWKIYSALESVNNVLFSTIFSLIFILILSCLEKKHLNAG